METLILNGLLLVAPGVEAPVGDVHVALVPVWHDIGGVGFGVPWQDVAVGQLSADGQAPFSFELTTPPPDLSEVGSSGMERAAYIVGAYIDEDADGLPGTGDTFVAAGLEALVYITGELSQGATDAGAREGWNTMSLTWDEAAHRPSHDFAPIVGPEYQLTLETNLLPVPRDALCGVIQPALGGPVTVGLLPMNHGETGAVAYEVDVDATMANASFCFPAAFGTPADENLSLLGEEMPGLEGKFGVFTAYAYPSDVVGHPDEALAASAAADHGQYVFYAEAQGFGAMIFPMFGVPLGWSLWTVTPDGQHAMSDWASGLTLIEVQPGSETEGDTGGGYGGSGY